MTPRTLLFVCTGNTCRSPMAEVQAKAQAAARGLGGIRVRSAGTCASEGSGASSPAVRIAAHRGLELADHRARALTASGVAGADLVIAMTRRHVEEILRLVPGAPVILATGFLPREHPLHEADVPDPFGGDLDVYAEAWEVLQECIESLFDLLAAGSTPDSGIEVPDP